MEARSRAPRRAPNAAPDYFDSPFEVKEVCPASARPSEPLIVLRLSCMWRHKTILVVSLPPSRLTAPSP